MRQERTWWVPEFIITGAAAPRLAEYVKDMGYTHVELMPVMEHPWMNPGAIRLQGIMPQPAVTVLLRISCTLWTICTDRGIGVILDWVPAHFPRDAYGMAVFDGTCVYEHMDPRKGSHPHWGTLIYNYGRPGVSNFLIANALFWADKYHADGIRMDAVAFHALSGLWKE